MPADKISAKSLEYTLYLVRYYHEWIKPHLWDFCHTWLAISAIKGFKKTVHAFLWNLLYKKQNAYSENHDAASSKLAANATEEITDHRMFAVQSSIIPSVFKKMSLPCFPAWKYPTNCRQKDNLVFCKSSFSKLHGVQNILLRPRFSYAHSHQISSFWSVMQQDDIKTRERILKRCPKGIRSVQQQDSFHMG